MVSVDVSLLSFIFANISRGTIFFAEDLEDSGFSPDEIRWSLTRLVANREGIVRLARGMFFLPEADETAERFTEPPTDVIAGALARRWKVRIAPSGAYAAYLSGLTGVPASADTWVSDGSDQVCRLSNGREVRFVRRLSLKVFQFRSDRMRNLVEGMRFLGRDMMEGECVGALEGNLMCVEEEDFVHDIMLAPSWIRQIMKESWNSLKSI